MNQEILNHRETISDLYPAFLRTQVTKKDWPKKDYKFNILEDLSEAEIEIENCKRVIDFTRTSFSVDASNQKKVHIIIENSNSSVQLL